MYHLTQTAKRRILRSLFVLNFFLFRLVHKHSAYETRIIDCVALAKLIVFFLYLVFVELLPGLIASMIIPAVRIFLYNLLGILSRSAL